MLEDNDLREGYCRLLGHRVPFSYCRAAADALPCPRILDCWFESFDVQRFIEEHYSPAEIMAFLKPPQPKLTSLVELMEKARK